MRVEKRKWDGTLSAESACELLARTDTVVSWCIPRDTQRQLPSKGRAEVVRDDELWVSVPGEWWVLCCHSERGVIRDCIVHAAAPFEMPSPDCVHWVDLDLDFEVHGDEPSLEDEAQFHAHARSMPYPADVVRGAWSGISGMAARYTTGEWPFDGWLQCRLDEARAARCA